MVGFVGNAFAIEAGLMAESYGCLPTEVLGAQGPGLGRMERFRIDRDIHTATSLWKQEQRDREDTPGGGASRQQRREAIQRSKRRAAERKRHAERSSPGEGAESGATPAPSSADQKAALDAALESRANDDPRLFGVGDGSDAGPETGNGNGNDTDRGV